MDLKQTRVRPVHRTTDRVKGLPQRQPFFAPFCKYSFHLQNAKMAAFGRNCPFSSVTKSDNINLTAGYAPPRCQSSVKSIQSSKRQKISARFFCQISKTTTRTENLHPVFLSNRYNPQKDRKSPPDFSVKSIQSSKRQKTSALFFCQISKTTTKTENLRPVFLSNQQNHTKDRKSPPGFSVKSIQSSKRQKTSARFFCQICKTTQKTENLHPVFLSNRSNPQKDKKQETNVHAYYVQRYASCKNQ